MSRLKLAPAAFLSLAACTNFPFFWKQEPSGSQSEHQEDVLLVDVGSQAGSEATLELQDGRYDGQILSARLLIGAKTTPVRLDKRLVSRADVHVNSVLECDSNEPVAFIMADAIPPPVHKEDLLILAPGYWYGTTVRFKLFSERFTGPGPECVDVELTVFSFEGLPLANTRIRVVRDVARSEDGGVRGALQMMDAGSP
jgi:hypothetical protein